MTDSLDPIAAAASSFRCTKKFVDRFDRRDPFNESNTVSGYICRRKGLMGGSLLITAVNGQAVVPQLIYGTPKLAYPYLPETTDFLPIKAETAYIAEKWNGVNILFFMYKDAGNQPWLSAKTKGSPFIANSEFGNFLDLTKTAMLDLRETVHVYRAFGRVGVVAAAFELCGTKEPHLVKYDFELALKPLFAVYSQGKIAPIIQDRSHLHFKLSPDEIAQLCAVHQKKDLATNEAFREAHGLSAKYEHDHFATEGKVLYPMDEDGFVLGRVMYKIKPSDTFQVHTSFFDDTVRSRVREALEKIVVREEALTVNNLRDELDMGPKEWGKFGSDIQKFCDAEGYGLAL